MDQSDQRDYAEEEYNRHLCPACDYSPCIGESCRQAQAALKCRDLVMTDHYKDLYENVLDTIALLAGQLREANLALEREQEEHLEKCAQLEQYRTLADYRQGKLERRYTDTHSERRS